MAVIYRYDDTTLVTTHLDPMEDILYWINGLRSRGYVEEVLINKHNLIKSKNLTRRAQLISSYAESAVNMFNQGFSGPIESSFLPFYYGIQNLAKIYIACSPNYADLRKKKNSSHGARVSVVNSKSQRFFSDVLIFNKNGTIPLFYKTITGEDCPNKYKFKVNDLYPYILNIAHEFSLLHRESKLQQCIIETEENATTGHRLIVSNYGESIKNSSNKNMNKLLKIFHKIGNNKFASTSWQGEINQIVPFLKKQIPRSLLYETAMSNGNITTFIPISAKKLLLPEELPIMLAFFHLSNIVRYYPESLFELKDSEKWSMVQALSRHGLYRFLNLFWAYFQQSSYHIFQS